MKCPSKISVLNPSGVSCSNSQAGGVAGPQKMGAIADVTQKVQINRDATGLLSSDKSNAMMSQEEVEVLVILRLRDNVHSGYDIRKSGSNPLICATTCAA